VVFSRLNNPSYSGLLRWSWNVFWWGRIGHFARAFGSATHSWSSGNPDEPSWTQLNRSWTQFTNGVLKAMSVYHWWWLEHGYKMIFHKKLGNDHHPNCYSLTFTPSFFRGVGSYTTNQIWSGDFWRFLAEVSVYHLLLAGSTGWEMINLKAIVLAKRRLWDDITVKLKRTSEQISVTQWCFLEVTHVYTILYFIPLLLPWATVFVEWPKSHDDLSCDHWGISMVLTTNPQWPSIMWNKDDKVVIGKVILLYHQLFLPILPPISPCWLAMRMLPTYPQKSCQHQGANALSSSRCWFLVPWKIQEGW